MYISPIYWGWLHSLCTRSAAVFLKVVTSTVYLIKIYLILPYLTLRKVCSASKNSLNNFFVSEYNGNWKKETWKVVERETLSPAHVLSRSVEPGWATRTLSEGMAAWAKAFFNKIFLNLEWFWRKGNYCWISSGFFVGGYRLSLQTWARMISDGLQASYPPLLMLCAVLMSCLQTNSIWEQNFLIKSSPAQIGFSFPINFNWMLEKYW